MDKFDLMGSVIIAACVLHNYIIEHASETTDDVGDDDDDPVPPAALPDTESTRVLRGHGPLPMCTTASGVERRQELLHLIT